MEKSIFEELLSFQNQKQVIELTKMISLAGISFVIAMLWTPLLTKVLYRFKLGKRIRKEGAPIFHELHKKKAGTPTMGGILIWVTVTVLMLLVWGIAQFFPDSIIGKANYLTRSQTLLPLGALIISALVGLVDDILNIWKIGPKGGGLSMSHKLLMYLLVAIGGAVWFYFKLDWNIIHIPALGSYTIGLWAIPLFIFIIAATSFSANEADGLDGLLGGLMMIAFMSYSAISYSQGKVELAIFCATMVGALLAFLWFNVYPARFIMGDTGSMSLGVTLGIVAMLTNTVIVLPLIASVLVIESLSVIVQMTSKKLFGKKIFHSTPIHHHFEAIGWPETKVTMRFWIIAGVLASIGTVIGIIGQG